MISDNQSQKAGDYANQLQAQTVNVYNTNNISGITEERARVIIDEKTQDIIRNYSLEAQKIVSERINEYATILIPKLVREQLLDCLKEPSVQLFLIETEKSATTSGKESDYELLSELLIHRVKSGENRNVIASVNRAVRIVDEISDEALQGITIAHSIVEFAPISYKVEEGLKSLDDLFSKISYDVFPSGNEWLEHLSILNVVRINSFGELKKIEQIYPELLSGYVDVGIKNESDTYRKATKILKDVHIPLDVFMDHELRDGYVRLKLINRSKMDLIRLSATAKINMNGMIIDYPVTQALSDVQKRALTQIYDLYDDDRQLRSENISRFMEMYNSFDSLRKVREWWDSIKASFTITPVGRVLAHANAQKCDPSLPPLDWE